MPQTEYVLHQLCNAVRVIGKHCRPVVRDIIDRNDLQAALQKFHDFRIRVIQTAHNCDSVKPPVSGPIHIRHIRACIIQKCHIVSLCLCRFLEALQNPGKEVMCESASRCILEQYTDIIASVRLQISCRLIRVISHFLCHCSDLLFRIFTDVTVIA